MAMNNQLSGSNGLVQSPGGIWVPPNHLTPQSTTVNTQTGAANTPAVSSQQRNIPARSKKRSWTWVAQVLIPLLVGIGTILVGVGSILESQQLHNNDQSIAQQTRLDDLLQSYRDSIGQLLLSDNLRTSLPDSDVRRIAAARTLNVLLQVDDFRRALVIGYISQLGLIQGGYWDTQKNWHSEVPIISLAHAYLDNIDFVTDFSGADLSDAKLYNAHLLGASLYETNLSGAILKGANLVVANLRDANLSGADLTGANLTGANLTDADLHGTTLIGTNLSDVIGLPKT